MPTVPQTSPTLATTNLRTQPEHPIVCRICGRVARYCVRRLPGASGYAHRRCLDAAVKVLGELLDDEPAGVVSAAPGGPWGRRDTVEISEEARLAAAGVMALDVCRDLCNCGLIETDGRTIDGRPPNCTCRVHSQLDGVLARAAGIVQSLGVETPTGDHPPVVLGPGGEFTTMPLGNGGAR
ncbi:MAG: hypothetical protein ACK4WH_00810 [Phycisphaerales bacterium]